MVAKLYQYRFAHREGLILQYNEGWGEIAPLPGFSKETLNEAKSEVLSILSSLSSSRATLPSVKFGIDCAKSPFSLEPLKVPLSAFQTPIEGSETLKLKIGHLNVHEAISLARKYKCKYRLRLDCNKKWNLQKALYFTSYFKANDFDYMEEPVSSFSELVLFSKISGFPVAIDESYNEGLLKEIPTLKAVIVKPMILGSVPTFSYPTILSSTYETSLGHLLIARLAPFNSLPLGLGTVQLCSDGILQPPLKISKGNLCWESSGPPINIDPLCLIASVP